MDFLIINSVQNLRGGDFLYLCIVRTARWTFGHWDEDATHILRGTARPLVGRCFSWLLPRREPPDVHPRSDCAKTTLPHGLGSDDPEFTRARQDGLRLTCDTYAKTRSARRPPRRTPP